MFVNLGSCVIFFNNNLSNSEWQFSPLEAGTNSVTLNKYIGSNTNVTVPQYISK